MTVESRLALHIAVLVAALTLAFAVGAWFGSSDNQFYCGIAGGAA